MKKKKAAASPVATVAKALSTLRSFIDSQDQWGVRELAVALNMPPSTVHRLLARFRLEGFASYDVPRIGTALHPRPAAERGRRADPDKPPSSCSP